MIASVPAFWKELPLIEVATLQRGFDLPVQDRIPGLAPVFAANGQVGAHHVAKVYGPGVVTGRSGSIGKVHFVERDYWPLNTALYVKDFHGNYPRFIFYLLQQMRLEQYHEGTGVPTLNRNNVHSVIVTVPPLPEQRRIAAILDKANELRAKRRAALAQIDTLTQAIFLEMFGHPSNNPKSLKREQLANLCKRVTVGHVGPMAEQYVKHGIPLLRSLNVRRGRIELTDLKFVSHEFHAKLKKSEIRAGDVVTVRTGQPGTTAVVPETLGEANCADLIIMTCGPKLNPQYLSETLNLWLGDADSIQGQVGAIQVHFNIGRAKDLEIPVPPITLQCEFARRVTAVEELKSTQRASLNEMNELFASLQHRAFRGEL
jgi:type I restriction enzyme S subunit